MEGGVSEAFEVTEAANTFFGNMHGGETAIPFTF